MTDLRTTVAAAIAATALITGGATLTGCSSENASTSCTLSSCTVTLQRGVDAATSVLGIEVKLVAVKDGTVTLSVGGNQVSVPTEGSTNVSESGVTVAVQSVTTDQVVLKISKN